MTDKIFFLIKAILEQYRTETKWTLINTRTQATLVWLSGLGGTAGEPLFLSSSERTTLGEGVFSSPVLHSRTALLFLTKAKG